jgi:hypothetical protein
VKSHSIASYTARDGNAGLKIVVHEECSQDELREIGEHIALAAMGEDVAPRRIFVWLYGLGMDLAGPASLLTFLEEGKDPSSAPTDPRMVAFFYHRLPVASC